MAALVNITKRLSLNTLKFLESSKMKSLCRYINDGPASIQAILNNPNINSEITVSVIDHYFQSLLLFLMMI